MMTKQELIEEVKLRSIIRSAIKIKLEKRNLEEQKLRQVIRHYLTEAKEIDADGNPTPYESTPLVFLADAFNDILKTVKDGLRSLQQPEERASYRLNMLEKFKNFFAKAEAFDAQKAGALGESDLDEQEVKVTLDMDDDARVMPSDKSEDERFTPREKSDEEKADEEFETEKVEDEDEQGAIWAFDVWNNSNIAATLSDKRKLLKRDDYKQTFKEYCLYNIDLWMMTYEKDIAKEKGQQPAFTETVMPKPAGAEVSPAAAGGDMELGDIPGGGTLEEF